MFENITKGYIARIVLVLLLFIGLVVMYTQFKKTDAKSNRVIHKAQSRSKYSSQNRGQAISGGNDKYSQKSKSKFGEQKPPRNEFQGSRSKYQDSEKKKGRLGDKRVTGDSDRRKEFDEYGSKKSKTGLNADKSKTKAWKSNIDDSSKSKKNMSNGMKKDQLQRDGKSRNDADSQNRKKDMDNQRKSKDSSWFQGTDKKPSLKEYQNEVSKKRPDGQKFKDEQYKDPEHKPSLKEYQEKIRLNKKKSSLKNDNANQKRGEMEDQPRSKDKAGENKGNKEVEGKEGKTKIEGRNNYGQNMSDPEKKLMDKLRISKEKSSFLEKTKEATIGKIKGIFGGNKSNKTAPTGVRRNATTGQFNKEGQRQGQRRQTERDGDRQKDQGQREDAQRKRQQGDQSERRPTNKDSKSRQFGQTGEKSRQFGQTGEKPRQFGQTGEKPRQFGQTGEKPRQFGQTGEQSRQFGQTGEQSRQFGQTGEQFRQFGQTGEKSRQFGQTGKKSGQFGQTGEQQRSQGQQKYASRNSDSPTRQNADSSANRQSPSYRTGPDSPARARANDGTSSARRNPDGGNRFKSETEGRKEFGMKDNARKYSNYATGDQMQKSNKQQQDKSNFMRSKTGSRRQGVMSPSQTGSRRQSAMNPGNEIDRLDRTRQRASEGKVSNMQAQQSRKQNDV